MPHALAGNRMKKHHDAIAASVEGVAVPCEPALVFVVVEAISISVTLKLSLYDVILWVLRVLILWNYQRNQNATLTQPVLLVLLYGAITTLTIAIVMFLSAWPFVGLRSAMRLSVRGAKNLVLILPGLSKSVNARPQSKWHLDEMNIKIADKKYILWRALDSQAQELDVFLQTRRNKKAAIRFLSRLLGRYPSPGVLVSDKLRSYLKPVKSMMPGTDHRRHKGLNNRAENSHQPTWRKEKCLVKFKSPRGAQQGLSLMGRVRNIFFQLMLVATNKKPMKDVVNLIYQKTFGMMLLKRFFAPEIQ